MIRNTLTADSYAKISWGGKVHLLWITNFITHIYRNLIYQNLVATKYQTLFFFMSKVYLYYKTAVSIHALTIPKNIKIINDMMNQGNLYSEIF